MSWIRRGLVFALVLIAAPAFGEYPIKITSAKVGLPPGSFVGERDEGRAAYVVKANAWAPVYVTLEMVKEVRETAAIVIETTDTDDLANRTVVPLQNLTGVPSGTRIAPDELSFIPYVRASGQGDVTVSICVPDRGSPFGWRQLSAPYIIRMVRTRDNSRYVVLSLGSQLRGFWLPKEDEQQEVEPGQTYQGKALRGGRVETARITNVLEMPDQWFGYESADLVVLGTLDDKFITSLFTDPNYKTRLDALLEWVRRGGRLVVSAGRNAGLASQFPVLQEILPVTIKRDDPTAQVTKLTITWWTNLKKNDDFGVALASRNGGPFPMANVLPKTDRSHWSLVPSPNRKAGADDRPSVLQSAFGLGRITFVAFDLDTSPFVDYAVDYRARFWSHLLAEAGSPRASTGAANRSTSSYFSGDTEDELARDLRTYIDRFEGVPVISFGWVALFILLYTLLIGPVEYYFLKKVLGRLELTWITFPIIVVTVSAIAYFTAYAIKGKDLKLNKVDLIDVDPASGRVYGRMWLTVFSPRIDTYRLGVTPNPGWTAEANESPTAGSLVDWFGGSRTGSKSIFRRNYYYHLDPPGGVNRNPYGDGIIDVPIEVWSTKSFSANWSAQLDKESPLVVSKLEHPPSDPAGVSGEFTLNLPLDEIRDATILYAGKAYKLENPIRPGEKVDLLLDPKKAESLSAWLSRFESSNAVTVREPEDETRNRNVFMNQNQPKSNTVSTLASVLFHEASLAEGVAPKNGTLRRLDQSARLSDRNRDEIIVVARLPVAKGPAEDVLTKKNSLSPTLLWIRELPGDGKPRTTIPGTLQQDTYLRIFVPIKRPS